MDLKAIGRQLAGDSKIYLKKNGPTILTAVGVAGFLGTTVLVARAAVKAKPVIDDAKHGMRAIENMEIDESYSQKQRAVDMGHAVIDVTTDVAKIYAPAIIVGAISVTCIISAHGMLRKQNMALVAAYGALDAGFKAYRKKIVEELGEDREKDIYQGVTGHRIIKDDETGDVCDISSYDHQPPSVYGRFFDETSTQWSKNAEYNKIFVMSQEKYFNDLLNARGYVFLNEVYAALGFEQNQAGQIVGWRSKKRGGVDGFIDFGIHDIADEISRAFINELERVIFLDFNVDGVILDKFEN